MGQGELAVAFHVPDGGPRGQLGPGAVGAGSGDQQRAFSARFRRNRLQKLADRRAVVGQGQADAFFSDGQILLLLAGGQQLGIDALEILQ